MPSGIVLLKDLSSTRYVVYYIDAYQTVERFICVQGMQENMYSMILMTFIKRSASILDIYYSLTYQHKSIFALADLGQDEGKPTHPLHSRQFPKFHEISKNPKLECVSGHPELL